MASAKSNRASTTINIADKLTPKEKDYFKKHEILVQGDDKNTWFPAKEWQMAMLAHAGFTNTTMNGDGSINITQHMICPTQSRFNYTIIPDNVRHATKVYLINETTNMVREMIILDAKPEHAGARQLATTIKKFVETHCKAEYGNAPYVSDINGGGRKTPFLSFAKATAKRGTKIPFSLSSGSRKAKREPVRA